jgi:hypothetical protein
MTPVSELGAPTARGWRGDCTEITAPPRTSPRELGAPLALRAGSNCTEFEKGWGG